MRSHDMILLTNPSKTIRLVLFVACQLGFHVLVRSQPPYPSCGNATYSVQNDSLFQSNLGQLLLSLQSNASASKFYKTTVGDVEHRVYGLFLCYNYVNDCPGCIATASRDVQNLCPSAYEAVVWEEHCQLHYSNKNFFSKLNVSSNKPKFNLQEVQDPYSFRSIVNETLKNLTATAVSKPSDSRYATAIVPYGSNKTIYAFVQCTWDLSSDTCDTCLKTATTDTLNCCYAYIGTRLLSESCFLRYEFYDFFPVLAEPPTPIQNLIPISGEKGNMPWKIAVPVVVLGPATLLFLIYLIYRWRMRKLALKRESQGGRQEDQSPKALNLQDYPIFDIQTLITATDSFSGANKLGEGGFGPVYKGVLQDGKEVAVKRMSAISEQGYDEFVNEVILIFKLQHKNLVKLLGFCIYGEEKLLVYEYMPNSSLESFMSDDRMRSQRGWERRVSIINGIAQGLLYLHQDSRLRIVHRDLKPSNVLLDKDMNPKISDFGTARIFGVPDGEANTARIAGTYGYIAPEYAMGGLYSGKSDVYSFGVILLEIITGRRNFIGSPVSIRTCSLTKDAWKLWNEGRCVELMDPLLIGSCSDDEFLRYMQIGLLCVQQNALDRPTMSTVVLMLKSKTTTLGQPRQPALSVGRFIDQHETCYNNMSMNNVTISELLAR